MSATKWKTRELVRPNSPRNLAIPHVQCIAVESEAEPRPEAEPEWLVAREPVDGCGFILVGMPARAGAVRSGRKKVSE